MSSTRRSYRSRPDGRDVVVCVDSRKHALGKRFAVLSLLATALGMTSLAYASGGPVGGQIVAGSGQIQQNGNTTTIRQSSPTLSLNWQSFNIAPDQTVDFIQPGSSAIAVNRIFGSTPSAIYGHLNANGQVWLINPNGILFGSGAQVNVGGLVASTLDLQDDTLDTSNRLFSGSGKGSIVNRGTLTAANGGYIALLGNQVSNQGTITAQLGTVALAGGSAVTLTFTGNQLVHLQVDQSTLNNLAENRQLIVADGGRVIMTAGAKDALLASVVNNTGVVQAQTVQNHNGTITLLGGMQAGQVNVGGTLDASAPNGGNGGSIETSAANFNLASDVHITAAAPHGQAGTWLIDPTDLTIDSASATTLSNTLNGGTSVTEQTTSSGATGVGVQASGSTHPGDIDVDSAISWNNSAATLTLQAYNGINVNAAISGGNEGQVVMQATGNSGGGITIAAGASIQGGGGVKLVTATTFVNNAGSAAVSTGTSAPWLIYSVNPASDTTGGLTPDFIQYNATSSTAPATTGNGLLYSVAPTLTVSGVTSTVSKTYDGTTTAPLSASNLTTSGLINGDKIASATGTYATSNAGSNIAVTTPAAISGFDITNAAGIPIYGYGLSGSATANIGTILQAQLTATIIGDPTKVYDGTTTATLSSSNYLLSGFVTGQGATVNQPSSVVYAGADAGSQQVNASFSITNFVANSGTNLSNYILPTSATGTGTITPAPVLLSGVLANNKVYDGGTSDTLNLSNASIYGVISQDSSDVSLVTSGGTGTFDSANAGNGIGVTLSGFSLTGAKADDYQLVAPLNVTADITPKALTITGVTANNKVYDGTTADTLNTGGLTLNGVVGSDVVTWTGTATGTFSQSDVGSNLAVSASGLSLTGAAAGNYTLVEPTGLTANITPAFLTISFAGSPAKIYDGTDAATLTSGDFTITGFVNGQTAVVSQSPAIYASPNAGSNISVTATLQPSDFTPASGTSLSNYTFLSTVTGLGTINPAPLVVSIVNDPTKVYDGTTTATLGASNYTLSGLIGGDSITLNAPTSGQYEFANAGVESVSATLTSGNYTAGSGTLLSNYALPTLASGWGTITPAPVGVSITASLNQPVSKVYDGTNTYLLNAESGGTYTQDFTLTGFQNGDNAYVNANITGYFASKNVGNNQPFQVTLNASDFTFACGSGSSCAGNYSFPTYVFTTGDITPAPLTVSLIGSLSKVYDGSTTAQLNSSNFQINGFVSGEGATITPTASFNYTTANAGSNIGINGTLTANNYNADSGTLLSNYTLQTAVSGVGNITQAPLFITGVYATDKVYDTTTSDTLNIGKAGLAGLVATDADNVTLNTSTSGTFAQSNVGDGIAVTANGFSISGSAAANYALQPISGLSANITPATLTISGVTAVGKVYDGTTSDTLDITGATLNGVLGSDVVALSTTGTHGVFITSNVGDSLAVTASGFSLTGAQAGNYTLTQPGSLSADITPAQLTAVITGSPTKVYDGTNSATLTASDYTLTGFVSGQSATIPQSATASYTTSNAGTGLGVESTLVVSDFIAGSGTLLSNYKLPDSASGNNGVITPYVLNLSGTRVYDAGTDALGNLFGTITGLNGDTFSLSGQGSVSSKNVGTYTGTGGGSSQPFDLDSLALVAAGKTGSGPDLASNYTLVGGADTLVITPAALTITGTTVNTKIYDGTTSATLGGTQTLQGVLSGDNVTINADVGNFASPNAGTNIAVASNITLGGTDGGNYVLTQPTGLTGTITQAVINLVGTRQYDAGTDANASAFGTNGVISTGVDGQTLDVTGVGSVSSQNVNTYTQSGGTFNLGSLALANGTGVASNYTLGSSGSFTVTPYVLTLTGTRVYDTTTAANAGLFGSGGVLTGVGGETLTLTGSGTVSSKNVGTYTGTGSSSGSQGFNLSTLTLNSNTGQASNYTLIGGTDSLTITKASLSITGTTVDTKTYDGTTNATLGGTQQLVGVLGSDSVTINADVGSFSSPNAGTNIPVSAAITLGGTDAGNYTLTQPTGLTGTIQQALINLAGTRQYDAGTVANASAFGVNGVISTGVAGQTLTVTGVGSVSSANANGYTQAGGTFNLGSLALSNGTGSASNYALGTSNTFTITPYVLSLSGTRVYDDATDANGSLFGGVLTGVNGETVNVSGSGVLSSKNVGTESFANLGTLALTNGTGLATNYTLVGGTDQVTVTPYVINLSGTRAYTGTKAAAAALFGSSGTLTGAGGETLTLSGSGTVSSANVGSYTGANFSLNTLKLNNGTGLASNYTLSGGVDTLTINPAVINLSGTRPYDANTDANATAFGNNGTINTGVNSETLTLTGLATVSGQNVGTYTGANFNAGTLALNNGTGLASNYTLVGGTESFAITPYVLSLSGTRVYDDATDANASLFGGGVLTGVNGETVNVNGSGVLNSKNAGTESFANLGTLALTNGTGLAGNYTLAGGTDQVTVTPYVINLNGSRAYDGTATANASLFGSSGALTGLNGETLTLNGSGTVTSANVGSYTGADFNLNTLTLVSGTGLASNYTLTGGVDVLTINPAVINLTGSRVYDATTDANASAFGSNGVISTGINGETLTLSGSGIVSSKNVGSYTGADFNLNTLSVTGNGAALASNYTLVGGTDALTITAATLTVSGTIVNTKTYDGTTAATLSGATLNGVFGGDSVTLGNDSVGTFATPNAGGGISVSSAMSISGGDSGNYVLLQPSGLTGTITPYVLNLSGTRVYDANTDANASLFGSGGVLTGLNGDTLTLSGSGIVSSKNVGSYTGADFNLNNLALTGNGSAVAGNYTLIGGTDTLGITPATLTVTGTIVNTKTYDGTTAATLSGATLNGVFSGDDVTLTNGTTGTFASPNAGSNIAVGNTIGITGGDAGNYVLTPVTNLTGTINPYVLNLSGTRVYDANTDANASLFGSNGVLTGINGDTLTLSGSGIVSSKNVGSYTGIDFNLNNLALTGNGSALAGNYTLIGGTDMLGITPATLTVTGAIVNTKTYDGSSAATLSGATLNGVFGGDDVTLTNDTTGTFASPNAGSNIAVSNSIGITGGDAGNYVLTPVTNLTGTINPYVLNLSGTRVYDANTDANASVFGSNGVLTGINGDTLTLSGSGIVSSKNVGNYTGVDFNLNNLALTGNGSALAGNYTLSGGMDTLTITQAPLSIIGTTAANKVYDGTTTASLNGSSLSGVFSGDTVTLTNDTTGTFASPNAANGIAVSTNMGISGTDAGNYYLPAQPVGITANITPYVLNLAGTRVYDAGTDADANLFGTGGVLTGINGETVNLGGSGVVSSKNVGNYTGSDFALGSLALSNGTGLASNYTLSGGVDTLAITALAITVDATGQNKIYDGNTTAGVGLASAGVLAGDTVVFGDGAANFSTANAGSTISIAVTGITASGADAGNYTFNTTAATSAAITPYVLNLTGTRIYDATTGANANLFGNNGVLTGVNGQTIDLSGSGVVVSKNVGTQRAFANLGTLALNNGTGLASNYTLTGGTDWLTITPATLTVIGTTATNRVYDGTTVDALNGATLNGVLGGDNVALGNDTSGLFGNKNVGNDKAVSTAMTISGTDAGNYILVQPTGLTANVTPLPIVVSATGTNRMYNGQVGDTVALDTTGVLQGDQVALAYGSANFANPYVGNNKIVTVSGITAVGADSANYFIVDPITTTTADISSVGFDGSGVQGSWIADLQGSLQPMSIATPYGSSDMDAVGVFTGNQKLKHRPIERNRTRSDFRSGLSLQLQNGGVRLPSDASP